MQSDFTSTRDTEAIMSRFRPYLLDILVAVVFILLPGIRGYADWHFYEYGLLLVIYIYIVYLQHKKSAG